MTDKDDITVARIIMNGLVWMTGIIAGAALLEHMMRIQAGVPTG